MPVVILAASFWILSSSFFFILGAVIPYYIPIFKKWPDKCKINSFKRFAIQLEFEFVHNMNSEPSLLLNIINMLMPAAIVREI